MVMGKPIPASQNPRVRYGSCALIKIPSCGKPPLAAPHKNRPSARKAGGFLSSLCSARHIFQSNAVFGLILADGYANLISGEGAVWATSFSDDPAVTISSFYVLTALHLRTVVPQYAHLFRISEMKPLRKSFAECVPLSDA